MDLKVQKRIAADVLKCSQKNVVLDSSKLATIKEALTKSDIRDLINSNIIVKKQSPSQSRVRARKIAEQKAKGLQKGPGSRRAKSKVRSKLHEKWLNKVRLERSFIKELREKKLIEVSTYRDLYKKVKGNFFRNKRHIKLHLDEQGLFVKEK
ncbi:MAG: 50S ribosomal protein L19e [Candidatus Woesearchaeota archaeon]